MQYTIKKGNHFASPYNIKWHKGDTLRYRATFDRRCYYDTLPEGQEGDWNKLGYWFHLHPWYKGVCHVWRWVNIDGKRVFQIGYYWHDKSWKYSGSGVLLTMAYDTPQNPFPLRIIVRCEINIMPEIVMFGASIGEYESYYPISMTARLTCLQPPYFGGQATAPHDMGVTIEML